MTISFVPESDDDMVISINSDYLASYCEVT